MQLRVSQPRCVQVTARTAGLLAVSADLTRPLVPMLKELTCTRPSGKCILKKLSEVERLCEFAVLRDSYWLDNGNLARLRAEEQVRVEERRAQRATERAGDAVADSARSDDADGDLLEDLLESKEGGALSLVTKYASFLS